jgi:hypothetical protein
MEQKSQMPKWCSRAEQSLTAQFVELHKLRRLVEMSERGLKEAGPKNIPIASLRRNRKSIPRRALRG